MGLSWGGSIPGVAGGGGGLRFRVPRDVFPGATRNAAIAARQAGLNAEDLKEFDADPGLLITLAVGAVDTYQARRAGQWRDVANVAPGPPGPGPKIPTVAAPIAVPAARTRTLGSNPLRLGPEVDAGQRLLIDTLILEKPAGRAATGGSVGFVFFSPDAGTTRTLVWGIRTFFAAAANMRAGAGGRIGDAGDSLYLASTDDNRYRTLKDIGAQDQAVSGMLVYRIIA